VGGGEGFSTQRYPEAIKAARDAKDNDEMDAAVLQAFRIQMEKPEDIQALYEAMKDLEGKVKDRESVQRAAMPAIRLIGN